MNKRLRVVTPLHSQQEIKVLSTQCATTAAAHPAVVAPAHDTPSLPPSSSKVNGCTPPADAMRIYPRCHASRGGQCASGELLGSFGGQLPGYSPIGGR
jgi:hypothetical protein